MDIEHKAEYNWVKSSLGGSRDIYVCCHYRPSTTDKISIPFLHRQGNHNAQIFIARDFNLPNWNREINHKDFINILSDNGLTQLVTKPTRLENTLDLIITNNPTYMTEYLETWMMT